MSKDSEERIKSLLLLIYKEFGVAASVEFFPQQEEWRIEIPGWRFSTPESHSAEGERFFTGESLEEVLERAVTKKKVFLYGDSDEWGDP